MPEAYVQRFGVAPIINAAGTQTRLGGAAVLPEVRTAMEQATYDSVVMEELQAAASSIIARTTGAEAGYVTPGAAAALMLGTAACLTGLDIAKMEALPDTSRMANQVIIARDQRNGYDHAIRATGAKLVEVGMNESLNGSGIRQIEAWEYEAAITDCTVAIAYLAARGATPPLTKVVRVAHRYKLPVIVDAANQLPPVSNLRLFIEEGADLVCFSGGKALRGPQNSGILCGRRDLIAAAALQQLDLDEDWEMWEPPAMLLPKEQLAGLPRQGIGRALKISKEAVVGLLAALALFTEERVRSEVERLACFLNGFASGLEGISGLTAMVVQPSREDYPIVHIRVGSAARFTAVALARKLRSEGSPRIYADVSQINAGLLIINPVSLDEPLLQVIADRLRSIMAAS